MPTFKTQFVNKLPIPASSYEVYWDDQQGFKGFGLRVTSAGKKTYFVQRRIKGTGKEVRYTIGEHGVITCDEARGKALKVIMNMKNGIDPRQKEKENSVQKYTLRQALADKLKEVGRNGPLKESTKAQYNQIFSTVFEDWMDRTIASIEIGEIQSQFKDMKSRTPIYAKQAFSMLQAVFEFASGEYDGNIRKLSENTVRLAIKKKDWPKSNERDESIKEEKIRHVWSKLLELIQDETICRVHVDLTMFLLLTGARLNEAAQLTWDRVNLEEGWWHLPDPKNKNPVWLPLSKQACEILKSRPRMSDSDYVFAALRLRVNKATDREERGATSAPREVMKIVSSIAGEDLSTHDLRRTFIRIAEDSCAIDPIKVQLLTNHKLGDVHSRHYRETKKLQKYLPEVQQYADYITGQV
jgi:integrase